MTGRAAARPVHHRPAALQKLATWAVLVGCPGQTPYGPQHVGNAYPRFRCRDARGDGPLDAAERHCLLTGLVDGVVELVEPHPSPVDAVVGDLPVLEIHGLDYVRLVALRGFARILPDQQPPVGEVPPAAEPVLEDPFAAAGLEAL